MHINQTDRTLLAKLCYYGAAQTDRLGLLRALHAHFAARMGELTEFDTQDFPPRAELELRLGEEGAARVIAASEQAFGDTYDQLTEAGTLVRMRTALDPVPGGYLRRIDVFAATGPAFYDALRRYCLKDADAVVFVADPRPARIEATLEMWENLKESGFAGPIVLLTIESHDPDELVDMLNFDGSSFAVAGDFEGSLAAFETAAKLATRKFTKAN